MSIIGLNDASANVGFLNLSTWSSTTCGIQILPDSVMMDCGGLGSDPGIPYNRIVFDISGCEIYGDVDVSGNLSVNSNLTVDNDLLVEGNTTLNKLDVSANLTVNGNLTYGCQILNSPGNITTTNVVSLLNFDGTSGEVTISMNNASTVGQLKIISRIYDTNNYNINVQLSGGKYLNDGAGNNFNTITFNNQGDSVTLMYVGNSNWTVISQNNESFSS